MTVETLYSQSIKPLPTADRLRLATLILEDIPPQALVDFNEAWSDADLTDFQRQNWARSEADDATDAG